MYQYYSKRKKILLIAIISLILLGSIPGAVFGAKACFSKSEYGIEEITISIGNKIERAIEVKGLENKFFYMKSMGIFSAAGAGGLGAPQIFAYSAEQFVELIPEDEPVYVALQYGTNSNGYDDKSVLKKVYWAFIENRAGLMVYEDVYEHQGWRIKDYNQEIVTFSRPYSHGEGYGFLGLFIIVVGLAVIVGGGNAIYNVLRNRPLFA